MGSMASFVWSTYALFAMTDAQLHGNEELVMHYMMEFYFESAAMILTLITVARCWRRAPRERPPMRSKA